MSSSKKKGKPVLPQGWVIRQSSSYPDMVYYFNTITGSTTWEMPQLIAKADSTMPKTDKVKKCKHSKGGTSDVKKANLEKPASLEKPSNLEKPASLEKSTMPQSDVTVSSSNEVKEIDQEDLQNLKRKRRAIMRELIRTEEEQKHPPRIYNKTLLGPITSSPKERKLKLSEAVQQRKFVLKRKSLDGIKIHKRTCSKFQKRLLKGQNKLQSSDVEMQDVSKELSPVLQLKSPLRDNPTQAYFIVVDTNILIHDLNFVDELKDKPLQGHGPPIIVIPWVVLQELDAIKTNKHNIVNMKPESPKQAAEAIKFLNTMLMAQHPRIRGQTFKMATQEITALKPKCNDDRVLHCCLQLIEVTGIPRDRVVLLTNDKNLCNKALISEVKAHTTDSILNDFQVDFCLVKKKPSVYSAFANLPENQQVQMIAEVKAEVDEIICRMKSILKECFSKILETEMKATYDDLWLKILYIQPPWSFLDVLECFRRHWYTVFNFIFSRNMFEHVETLRNTMRATKGYIHDERQASEIISAALSLCCDVEQKYPEMPAAAKELRSLQKQCQLLCEKTEAEPKQTKEVKDSKAILTMDEKHNQIMIVFQHTWASLNAICGTVLDTLGRPHNYRYQAPIHMPTKKETADFIVKLYGPLRHLSLSMHNVLRSIMKADGSLYKVTNDLYKCLTSFLPDLDLPMPIQIEFSAKDLEDFCRNPEKKELLDNGNQQLLNFYSSIQHCVNSFSLIS